MHAEGSLPLIARGNVDKVVGMAEIDLGIYFGFGRRVEEVRDERKGIPIFLGDFVEATVVYTEAERAILLFDKQDRSAVGGGSLADEAVGDVLVDESPKGLELGGREGVDGTERRRGSFLQVYLEVEVTMWRQLCSFRLGEDISELVIISGDGGEIWRRCRLSGGSTELNVLRMEL